ncbi:MAG TPA: acetolactate synthase large subunit [Candidatus Bilamarchaeum sp.]|nr:acetolactate synthase large subunit [Candidatus Bilamarchaeum sp.]
MKGSEMMVKCLLNEGAQYIFGLPGEENIEFLDSLSGSGIGFITTRHEQGAAFMADVYGRIKHKPGVCLSTLGPGAMNLTTGVANANLDHSPLVAITGQSDFRESHFQYHQYIDVVKAFEPITKWNARITSADAIPELVRKAFRVAMLEKQGATHLELPNDIAGEKCEGKPLQILPPPKSCADQSAVKKAAQMIVRSKYPVILSGNGVVRTGATESLRMLAEKAGIPVAKTFMSKGSISSRHPLSVGVIGLQSGDIIAAEFRKADCVIAVGYDVEEFSPQSWNPEMDKTVISIDTVPEPYLDRFYDVDIELIGDIECILNSLASHLERREPWNRAIRERLGRAKADFTPGYPIKPQHFLSALRAAMEDSDILVSDVGMHKLWVSRLFETYEPNTVVISNGLASMGIALPGAIGAKLARPEVNVVSVSGDGGFLMNCQELETAKRIGASGVHIIWTDNSYGLIEWKQQKGGKAPFGVRFGNPDFVKLAESFGIKGYRIERAGELPDILKEAVKSGELCVIDVPIDQKEYGKVSSASY